MEYVLLAAFVIVAVCMALGKPLQITIHHKYDVPQSEPDKQPMTEEERKKFEEEQRRTFDDVIRSIQDVMGVNVDDGDNNSQT